MDVVKVPIYPDESGQVKPKPSIYIEKLPPLPLFIEKLPLSSLWKGQCACISSPVIPVISSFSFT